jgi:hypothetical protein
MAKHEEQGAENTMEHITLENDTGASVTFTGKLFAEHSFYDEESGVLMQQKLYVTQDGDQAYSVVSSDGKTKEKRAYLIKRMGHLCKINNGLFDVTVNANDLLAVVRGLCGLTDKLESESFFEKIADPDKAVNE